MHLTKQRLDIEAIQKLKSYNPKVCMDRRVHYTVQTSVYERIALGLGAKPRKSNKYAKPKSKSSTQRIVDDLLSL
jgi:hypothetical protein